MRLTVAVVGFGCLAAAGAVWAEKTPLVVTIEGENKEQEALGRALEPASYLGVVTMPVDETLGRQLGLPGGVGLVVGFVDPKSPAVGKLEPHDVLHTVNDQVLFNPPQFAALIRTFKPGTEIRLTVVRGGKPMTVAATLAEKNLPKLTPYAGGMPGASFGPPIMRPCEPRAGECLLPGQPPPCGGRREHGFTIRVNEGGGKVLARQKGDLTLTLTVSEKGGKQFKVVGKDGKVLFEGPVDTPAQVQKVPESYRDELEQLEKNNAGIRIRVEQPEEEDDDDR
jgi:hypothetical protein